MLEQLRNASDRPWAKVLIGVLIFSFVGWGVASWIFGEDSVDDSLLKVGARQLKIATFERERNMELGRMTRDQQKQIYSDKMAAGFFHEQIISSMTSKIMLEERATDLGLTVATGAIADTIHRTKEFQENGRFSLEKFDALLSANGMTEDYYADNVKNVILRNMVLAGVSDYAPVAEFASVAAYNSRYVIRDIKYTAIKYSDFNVVGNPTDENLKEVYAKNPKMIPEMRSVSYVLVPVKNMGEPNLYDNGYTAAQKLEDTIVAGDTLAAAAQKNNSGFVNLGRFSADKKNPNGIVPRDILLTDQMTQKIFAMEQGIESEIIETKSGFAIFRVENIEPSHAVPMESMRAEIIAKWKKEEQKKQAYLKANAMLSDLNAKKSVNLTPASVSRANGADLEVLSAAFANNVGVNTIVTGENTFYVLSVVNEKLPTPNADKMAALRMETSNMMSRVILDDYTSFLARKYPVKVNAKMYKRMFGN